VVRCPSCPIARRSTFAVVVINTVFSFIQERRSDHAAERLNALLPRRVTVRRDGQPVEIDAGEIVVGDVMLLSPGDRISADATFRLSRLVLARPVAEQLVDP
jgi:P-type E1-E2 ATPase